MDAAEYERKITDLIVLIVTNGDEARRLFTSAEKLGRELVPDMPDNWKLFEAVKKAKLGFTVAELKRAMNAHATQSAQASRRRQTLHCDPANEREYCHAFMASRGYDMDYHRRFYIGTVNTPMGVRDILNDMVLTAADLDLLAPRAKRLSKDLIGVALEEWATERRAERRQAVIDRLLKLPEGKDKATIDAEFSQVCAWYAPASEAAFFEAACRKFIWQVKRRWLGLPIKHVHMICLIGPQDTGKTEWCKMLYSSVSELAIEAALRDLLDTRQLDMPEYSVAFCDELAFAEDAKPAHLKTFLNGGKPSRRPMRMNTSERIEVNVSLIATANHSLDKLIFDSSGMRRFVEVRPRTRAEIEPYWDAICSFDWEGLWQSIDPYSDDPLVTPFRAELFDKQESIRNMDNTELWLSGFDVKDLWDFRYDRSDASSAEWFSDVLYKRSFREWESSYDPGYRGTSHQRWARDFRSLIANGRAEGWYVRDYRNKTLYGKRLDESESATVVPFRPRSSMEP